MLALDADSCCRACGVSLQSGTQLELAASAFPLTFNIGPTRIELRTVQLRQNSVFVNSDLEYDEEDFVRKISLSHEEAHELLEWLGKRKSKMACAIHLRRVGFGARNEDDEEQESAARFEIKRLKFVAEAERAQDIGRYFASHFHKGGPESFWPAEFHSARVQTVGSDVLGGLSDIESDCDEKGVNKRINLKSLSNAEMLERLDSHCVQRPGEVVHVNYPGARGFSSCAAAHRNTCRETFCTDEGGQCLRAALLNAVNALCGAESASKLRRVGRFAVRNLGALSFWVEKNASMYRLEKVRPPALVELDKWVTDLQGGESVLILRIVGKSEDSTRVDHCIAVDCARREVSDSCEKHVLRLSSDVIRACVGDGVVLERIEEVRRLAMQPTSKKGTKRRRRTLADKEKRLRRRRK